ncbi:MAG: FAD-dependent monooxygenase [Proteobacteria bacterium]|nr:FAD-dependent monooxygenase [Pseudomonadota bacterium]
MNSSFSKTDFPATAGHDVVIAGGGPTGLMLAAELKLAGVDVGIIEQRASQELQGARARGMHARTIEVLDQRGVAERFLAQGKTYPVVHFHVPLDISDFPTRHNYTLGLLQNRIERTLAEWVGGLGVPIHREREVTGFAQDGSGVDVQLADGNVMRADYLVGCDGARSVVRKAAGIAFPGWDAATSWLICEAGMSQEPDLGFRYNDAGMHAIGKLEDGRVSFVSTERQVGATGEPTLHDIRAALVDVYGADFGIHDATWISRFTDMARQAQAYRDRRVLLAGDAAHVHAPLGGHGLNTGVQDAVNLGWKLAQAVKGIAPGGLLDSYHAERHPVAARVLRTTLAHVAISRRDDRTLALAEIVSGLLRMDEPRARMAGEITALDIRYDFGEGHPLLGRRMPDLDIVVAGHPTRVFERMRDAKPLLLNFAPLDGLDIAPWSDRVRAVDAKYTGAWELPVIGKVAAPAAVLVRPDGHVAWVGDGTDAGLGDALGRWFGPPAAA